MATRRNFLFASAALASGAYVYHRTLRFPRLGFEHHPPETSTEIDSADFRFTQAIIRKKQESDIDQHPEFRATGPKPTLHIQTNGAARLNFNIGNIASNARLSINAGASVAIDEKQSDLNRTITITTTSAQPVSLAWLIPENDAIKFAAIGDTGGGYELEWVLQKALELGAQFLLHLGDFNYSEGEYNSAIELFDNAKIPSYIAIGNHDYNADGLVYPQFLDKLSPFNQAFELAGTRFVNFDTAASFLPPGGGQRGQMFDRLTASEDSYTDTVFFTHRPFVDIREDKDHDISGLGEMPWLAKNIKQCGGQQLLCGHVHKSGTADYEGIHQWTAGEGLGFDDIVQRKQVAQILIGEIRPDAPVQYGWQLLDMPWWMHRSPTNEKKLLNEYSAKEMQWYKKMLIGNPANQQL